MFITASNVLHRRSRLRSLAERHEVFILFAILVLFVVVGLINPRFLSGNNINTIFAGSAYVAVAAIGMSMLIVTGNIDVSIGALIGVLATISGVLVTSGYPIWVAWLVPLAAGMAINGLMGLLVAYTGIPSIVVSLGLMSILRGGLISSTGGFWISNLPSGYLIAQKALFGIPVPIIAMIVLTLIASLWMLYSGLGRAIYAIGGNAEAARANGVPIKGVLLKVYLLHGLFAGLASVLFATQLQVIQSTVPDGLELTVITAAVVGGVSILGGSGTVIGSTLATILFAAIGSAMIFVNISAFWLRAVIGALILVTVLADMLRRHQLSKAVR